MGGAMCEITRTSECWEALHQRTAQTTLRITRCAARYLARCVDIRTQSQAWPLGREGDNSPGTVKAEAICARPVVPDAPQARAIAQRPYLCAALRPLPIFPPGTAKL